jgi:hypothetical protein
MLGPSKLCGAALTAFVLACSAAGARDVSPGVDLQEAVEGLKPGDELVLRGGIYRLEGRFVIEAKGTQTAPIVIRAAAGETPVIRQEDSESNIVEIEGSRHLVLRGLEFLGGSHGIHLEESDFVTIDDCHIHHTGDVAIAANSGGTYEGLRVLGNHIHDTDGSGEGMYLGCNNDECRVANSLIEGNWIHNTNGPTVEEGDGIELKEGSYGNVIRDNVVHDTRYPGIIVYGTVGNGPPNLIERNAVWNAGEDDNAIQAAADAIIRNNIVLGAPIALQPHQAASPANIEVVHNTVICADECISVRDPVGQVVIANNALYAQDGDALSLVGDARGLVAVLGNVGTGDMRGRDLALDFVEAHFRGVPPIDVFPKAGSALIGAGDATHVAAEDFNGTARGGSADAGAYAYSPAGNPGWKIAPAFKRH